MDPDTISVVLVEDEMLGAASLALLLSAVPGVEVIAIAQTVALARAFLRALRPRIALMDRRLPDGDGIALVRELAPELADTRWIVVSAYRSFDLIEAASLAGVHGLVDKLTAGPERVVEAVCHVAAGGEYYCPASVELMQAAQQTPVDRQLTPRQREILQRIARGETRPQIAADLEISQAAVTAQLARTAHKLGFDTPPEPAKIVAAARASWQIPNYPPP